MGMQIYISGKNMGAEKKTKAEENLGKHISEQIGKMRGFGMFRCEESRQEYEERIMRKVRTGKKLTGRELAYIRRTNPAMYMRIKRIQIKREVFEQRLKSCKSKVEAQEVFSQAIAAVSEKDLDREAIIAAYKDAWEKFKESGKYQSLPETVDMEEEHEIYPLETEENPMRDIEELYFYEERALCFDTKA